MARQKFDGVIDAVHFMSDGALAWVRMYERRGPTFSDLILVDRSDLVQRLKAGKKYVLGQRILLRASEFEITQALHLVQQDGHEFVALDGSNGVGGDNLKGAPVI